MVRECQALPAVSVVKGPQFYLVSWGGSFYQREKRKMFSVSIIIIMNLCCKLIVCIMHSV